MHASTVSPRTPASSAVNQTWPWHLFAALFVVFALALTLYYFFPPTLTLSSPTLSSRADIWRADFRATNHTDQPVTATILVTFGLLSGKGPSFRELGRTEVVATLAPKQQQSFSCDFSPSVQPLLPPNAVRAEVLSYRR